MNNYPVTTGSSYYAGAMVPYAQRGPAAAWEAPPAAIDVYEPSDGVEYRPADLHEIKGARNDLKKWLDYYAENQLCGSAWMFTRTTVEGEFAKTIRNMVTGDVLFNPEDIFSLLQIGQADLVKSRKHYWQIKYIDRDKEQAQQHCDAKTKIKATLLWIECVAGVTQNIEDNPNAFILCEYADFLTQGALDALANSDGDWPKEMIRKYEKVRGALHQTMQNNELAGRDVYG